MKNESKGWRGILLTAFLTVLAVFFLIPVFLVLMNSLKGQFYISDAPFALPNFETFVGLRNYWNGIEKVDFSLLSAIRHLSPFFRWRPSCCLLP